MFTGARNTLPVFTPRERGPCTRAVYTGREKMSTLIYGPYTRALHSGSRNPFDKWLYVMLRYVTLANLNGLVFVKDCDESVDFPIKYLGKLCSIELNRWHRMLISFVYHFVSVSLVLEKYHLSFSHIFTARVHGRVHGLQTVFGQCTRAVDTIILA